MCIVLPCFQGHDGAVGNAPQLRSENLAPRLRPALRRFAVPIPGRRIIVYSGRNSSAESVRADITYLRQDFSVRHEMEEPAPWPEHQRFDYFVRTNRISEVDARYLQRRYRSHDYPQRRSVLFALQQLEAQHWTNVIASSD